MPDMPIMLPPFRLYGLIGCPHCVDAERFIRSRGLPTDLVICNGDPIIAEGLKKVVGEDSYPVLLCRNDQRIIKGFNVEEYDRLAKDYFAVASASAPSIFGGGQQPQPEVAAPVAKAPEGAN